MSDLPRMRTLQKMETFEIAGRDYPITGYVTLKSTGQVVPLVDIPMMSDYKWQLDCLYERYGEDVAATIAHLRQWLEKHREEATT